MSLSRKIELFIFAPMWTSFWGSFLQNHILVLFNFLSGNEYNLTSNLLFKYRGHHIRSGEGQYGRWETIRAVNETSQNFKMEGEVTVTLLHLRPFHTFTFHIFTLKDLCWAGVLMWWVIDIKFVSIIVKFPVDSSIVSMGDGTLLHKSNATKIHNWNDKKHF